MRVVLFTDSDAFAGTEQHMLDLADGLGALGVGVRIACPVASIIGKKARDRGFEMVPIEKRGTLDVGAIAKLRALLRCGAVDIIHAHNGRTALSAVIAVRLAKRGASVATQHFLEPHRLSRRGISGVFSRVMHAWIGRETGQFVAVSRAACEGMVERGDACRERISVVHNGIADPIARNLRSCSEVRGELNIEADAPLIVSAARLEPEKDVTTLISAVSEVRRVHPEVRCVIAGEGSLRNALREQIRAASLETHVRLVGFRTDAISIIGACDLYVLPSIAEPFGLVVLEAMALRKSVVATDAGGPREIVVHGETGLLVPPRSPEGQYAAISRMLARPNERTQFGDKGRRRFEEKFTAGQMAARTVEVYRDALSRSRKQRIATGSLNGSSASVACVN